MVKEKEQGVGKGETKRAAKRVCVKEMGEKEREMRPKGGGDEKVKERCGRNGDGWGLQKN